MSSQTYQIPMPLARVLSALPTYPGSAVFAQALNLALRDRLPDDMRLLLRDKRVAISVKDAQVCFRFRWDGRHFVACQDGGTDDLRISAGAHDFFRLARRQDDPDTLFFNRRLVMEGDTELALAVKNMLDAMETPVFQAESFAPWEVLKRIKKQLGKRRESAPL